VRNELCFRFGVHFETTLLLQSIVMIVVMFIMLELCIRMKLRDAERKGIMIQERHFLGRNSENNQLYCMSSASKRYTLSKFDPRFRTGLFLDMDQYALIHTSNRVHYDYLRLHHVLFQTCPDSCRKHWICCSYDRVNVGCATTD